MSLFVHGSKVDDKAKELIKLLDRVRHDIEVDRIIGLNVEALRSTKIGNSLFGYMQISALESLALGFCKIFEEPRSYDLNSIPGIIESLPEIELSKQQVEAFATFGRNHGNESDPSDAKEFLKATFENFTAANRGALDRLKAFRDTIGAHSDFNASQTSLGFHEDFESLFDFALRFYQLVARWIIDVDPGYPTYVVQRSLIEMMKTIGIANPKIAFDSDQ